MMLFCASFVVVFNLCCRMISRFTCVISTFCWDVPWLVNDDVCFRISCVFFNPSLLISFVAKVLCYWDCLPHSHWQLLYNQFGSGHLGFIGTCGVQHAAYCTLHAAYYDMFLHRCVLHAALTALKLLILNRIAAAVLSRLLLEIYQCHSLSICPFCCSFVLEGWSFRVRAGVDMIFPDSSQDRPQQMSDQIWSPKEKASVG